MEIRLYAPFYWTHIRQQLFVITRLIRKQQMHPPLIAQFYQKLHVLIIQFAGLHLFLVILPPVQKAPLIRLLLIGQLSMLLDISQ